MTVLEMSRVDRLEQNFDLASLFPNLSGPFTAADLALVPPRTSPNGSTVWTACGVTAGVATPLFAGPDADSSGAFVVTGSADVWLRVTVGAETDAAKAARITLLGSGTVVAPGPVPPVLSIQGRTGAVTLSAADVGADASGAASTAQAAAISAAATDATSKASAAQAYAIQRGNHTGTQVASTISDLGTAVAADPAVRAAYGLVVSVKDPAYGATGDGTTDDTAAIQAAIAAVSTVGGGTVFFPAGNYLCNSDLVVSSDAVVLAGVGRASTIQLNGCQVRIDGTAALVSYCGLHALSVRRTGTAGIAVYVVGGASGSEHYPVRWWIDHCHFESIGGTALRLSGTFLGTVSDTYMRNSHLGLQVIAADDGLGLSGNAISFHGGEIQAVDKLAEITAAIGVSFFGTTFEDANTAGIELIGYNRGFMVHGSYFEANAGYDIKVGTVGYCKGIDIRGNYFASGASKVASIRFTRGDGINIESNNFVGYSGPPVLDESPSGGVLGQAQGNSVDGGATEVSKTITSDFGKTTFPGQTTFGDGTGNASVVLNGAPGSTKQSEIRSAGSTRWLWNAYGAEGGSNAGTDLQLLAYDDTGAYLGPVIEFARASRQFRVYAEAKIDGNLRHAGSAVGFNGATPVGKAANPGTAAGTDAAVINAIVTALRNLGLVT